MKLLMYRFVAVAFVLLIVEAAAFGQSRARIVKSPMCPSADDEVLLELAGPRIAGTEVPFDKAFAASDDWLAQLVFRVTNKGKKHISAIVLTAGLLGTVDEELAANASYDYGLQFIRVHPLNAGQPRSKRRSIVAPGEEIEITADGAKPYGLRYMDATLGGSTNANDWSEFAAKAGQQFQKLEIMRADVWFTDGSNEDARLVVRGTCNRTSPQPENVLPPVSRGLARVLNKHARELVKPRYPAIAKKARASGEVLVSVLINEEGEVVSAEAVKGHPLLLAVSVEAARKSLFHPMLIDGAPVKVTGLIQYNFIEGAKAAEVAKHDDDVADICVDCPSEEPSKPTGILNGRALKLAKPSYPDAAREARASGLVVVRVLIDEKGKVISAEAVSGHPALHDVSVVAAKKSLFSPTLLSGTPVKVTGVIHYNFVPQ